MRVPSIFAARTPAYGASQLTTAPACTIPSISSASRASPPSASPSLGAAKSPAIARTRALSVCADTRVPDLAVAVDRDFLVLQASTPVSLRLSGPSAAGVQRVSLNGRESLAVRDRTGEILIAADAWAESVAGERPVTVLPLALGA